MEYIKRFIRDSDLADCRPSSAGECRHCVQILQKKEQVCALQSHFALFCMNSAKLCKIKLQNLCKWMQIYAIINHDTMWICVFYKMKWNSRTWTHGTISRPIVDLLVDKSDANKIWSPTTTNTPGGSRQLD